MKYAYPGILSRYPVYFNMTKIQFDVIIGVKNDDFTEITEGLPEDTSLGPFEKDCIQHCCIRCIPEIGIYKIIH